MDSRKNLVVKKRRSASQDTPSTAAKPPRPAPLGTVRASRSVVEATSSAAAEDDGSEQEDGSDGDDWVEVDEGYQEVDEAEAYDRDDNMSEPSVGLNENQDDAEVEVNDNERTKKGGKRKKGVAVGKVKERRTRVKRAECWKHFKEVKAVSKKKPGTICTKAKFDKYWDSTYAENSNGSTMRDKKKVKNNVMVIATILDPRFKMKLVEYCFKELYGREKGMSEAEDIKKEFFDLYASYEMESRQNGAPNSNEHISDSTRQTNSSMSTLSSGFQSFLEETNSEPCKSELNSYLDDKTHPIMDPNFTLLDWWRLNAHRYPIVAKMAKKFLTVPATSVSSESTFSTGGRVLDDYRSSLHPKMVEALVCASSFIKGSKENRVTPTIILEDDIDEDVEFIPFPESSVESN